MAVAIQRVVVGDAMGVATGVSSRIVVKDAGELVLNAECHSRTVAHYKADCLDSFHVMRFRAMFTDERNNAMFYGWSTRRDKDMGA